ncbi:hypothetical protein CPB86DRAFT_820781 [Serendipita vermifera]|nr:hypothetical protein CPB86DRAFT_820781 [Serendipita vermifera]
MDARKVVYVASWKDLDMTKALDIERSRNDFWLKEILEGCRKDLEDAKFPIVDRNDVPLTSSGV